MDYKETFSSITNMTIVYIFIVVAFVRQWHISYMDIKNAFLNVDLQEVYMVPLFGVSHNLREVYKLKKAL